jgi:three-Cys-motif partner protein
MVAPKSTIWDIEPHTTAKHAILRRYLEAWLPILSQAGYPDVLYLDGFAGPGRYSKGEPGSPIIALQVAAAHKTAIKSRVYFRFVEKDEKRSSELVRQVSTLTLPSNFIPKVHEKETFESAYEKIKEEFLKLLHRMPPTFAFIDPFGWTGVPFAVIADILSSPSCEVFINFMYDELNRFIGLPEQRRNFDEFFGTPGWRDGIQIRQPTQRNRFLHDLYLSQLREIGRARYIRSFEMRNERDVTDYYLFYATNNRRGMSRMKDAMWKIDESGAFQFSDATNPNQQVLFSNIPDFDILQAAIVGRFRGTVATVDEIEDFVIAETAFRVSDYKTKALKPLELGEPPVVIPLNPPSGRRRGTYADPSLRLRFA